MAPRAAGGEHDGSRPDEHHLSGFDANGDGPNDDIVLVLDQIGRRTTPTGTPFPRACSPDTACAAAHVPCGPPPRTCAKPGPPAKVFRLAAERSLVYAAVLVARKRQAHVLEFINGPRTGGTHELDGVLVADVVRSLDRVIHVPAPIVVRIVAAYGAGDAALGGHGVRTGRKYLGKHSRVEARFRELQTGAHAGTAAADDDAVEFQYPQTRQASLQITEKAHAPYVKSTSPTVIW